MSDHESGLEGATYIAQRAALIANSGSPTALCRSQLADLTDTWVQSLATSAHVASIGGTVVAVGGYGRKELSPGSDLDIMLLVDPSAKPEQVMDVANALWYPIWDAGLKLDHSVRTIAQARQMAAADLKVVLGMMDARTVYGHDKARKQFMESVLADWRALGAKRLMELHGYVRERMERYGDLAHMLEPDLKESYGGLRDFSVLRAIAASGLADVDLVALDSAHDLLLNVRDALHRVTGRATDRLMLQEQQAVAELLKFDSDDSLLRAVCAAGRSIGYVSDLAWYRIKRQATQLPRSRWSRRTVLSPLTDDTVIAEGVLIQDGEAVLGESARPASDPVLTLRAAAAAAQNGVHLSPATVDRLAKECPALPTPWPREAREALVSLIGAGRLAIPVWESLDQRDLITFMIPEWQKVRSAPQHNPVHTFTVDRHLVETAVNASNMTRRVSRPDLLLIGSLLHDIGKGQPGDHSEVGERIVRELAPRMGFKPDDVESLALIVRQHLLLPEMATRRDLDDPATISHVADIVKTHEMLDILHALSESDSRATGPAVNSEWRFALMTDLVQRVHAVISGEPTPEPPELTGEQQALATGTKVQVMIQPSTALTTVTVAAPDSVGLLSTVAGVLAVHRLNVRTAMTQTIGDRAVSVWGVTSKFGDLPTVDQIRTDLERALAGEFDVTERLNRRYRESMPKGFTAPEPTVTVIEDASARATVLELRAHDMPGLLHLVTRAISATGADIIAARVSTLGSEIVDAFYVVDSAQGAQVHLSKDRAAEVQQAILTSLA